MTYLDRLLHDEAWLVRQIMRVLSSPCGYNERYLYLLRCKLLNVKEQLTAEAKDASA